jgi:hypothetical protein
MSGQNPIQTQVNVIGADKKSIIVFSNVGTTPIPASAGVAVTATKNAASQVVAVHGTISGIVFDSPA